MDEAYAKSLVDVWHRAGGAGCVTTTELPEFKPPKLGLKSLGDLVVLFDKEQEFDENQEEDSEDEKLMACHLDRCDLEQQAWANVLAHSMDQYEKWTTLIGNGRFNGRVDWEATSVQCTCVCN
ncbi:hypothetical protein CH63R_03971 [Colletotrichum higginsianum IMI 349063]|uniref:Uncharacterized protein n=1 Tax=Colletotrichum higginsianum (strain IMI 349063) TaxID=759273 RepID=A0A1B7YI39_COLHI|nr:hypothetical protein CH63R_03971 [Colletotrichum higginsianum IMI 349063]OBR11675.1 hypothetical protein CH63R_03971 [Colletotrichum higginsianum IMI 349063]